MPVTRRNLLAKAPGVAAALALLGSGRPVGAAPLFDIRSYGALESGSAARNKQAFVEALAAAQAAGGSVLIAGQYQTDNLAIVSQSGASIVGMGRNRSKLTGASGLDALVSIVTSDNVRWTGVDLETDGVAAIYGAQSDGLLFDTVATRGGRTAGIYMDRCDAATLRTVAVRYVRQSGGIGGTGLWVFRGGTGIAVDGLTVEDTENEGIKIDSGTTADALHEQCTSGTLRNLLLRNTAKVASNGSALLIEGGRNITVTTAAVDTAGAPGVTGHAVVMQQDQSTDIPQNNVVTGLTVQRITGFAVALVGAQNNQVNVAYLDSSGLGASSTSTGLGGAGTASSGNTVTAIWPGR